MDKLKRKIYLDKIIKVMKNDFPLFKNMRDYGFYDQLSEEELKYVLSTIFGEPVTINKMSYGFIIYYKNGKLIYRESNGYWVKYEYDQDGNRIYYENSDGKWWKKEYDKNGNEIYYENSNGEWEKSKYDEYGNEIYYENSNGYWRKSEYDKNGNEIYYENSDGVIVDNK
jgi:hypothetical protein